MPSVSSATNKISRLVRLWSLYARMDALWITRDMKMFLTWSISDTLFNIGGLLGMLLLAQRFAGIGAWTKVHVLFLLSYSAVCGGLLEMFFGFNVSHISRRIGRGQLDHLFVQPQPLWMALITEGFCPFSGFVVVAPGLCLMAWTLPRLGVHLTFTWFLALLLNMAASTVITLSFQFVWGSIAFWAPRAAEEINTSTSRLLHELRPFPLDGLGPALTAGLLGVLPSGFLGWVPSRVLTGLDTRPLSLWITPVAAIGFALIAVSVFQKGLTHYGRTGSQRYLPHGHRG